MNTLRYVLSVVALFIACSVVSFAQPNNQSTYKLSTSLRALLSSDNKLYISPRGKIQSLSVRRVCALVRTSDATDASLIDNGCRLLTRIGDIYVADIPVSRLGCLAADRRVCRIEAERGNALQLDSIPIYANSVGIYSGYHLPQAYTGSGVVVGLMDVGFDVTHPSFRTTVNSSLRIRRFWDQLSVDTINSQMYVGAEYTDEQSLLAYAHSRDGMSMWHGTHTLGIAAGNGAGTPYVGMAPESDICLVSNAVSGDEEYISDADLYKYTTATDVLGFKYLFDYAESVGKPCVVSFSEGAPQDFHGDNLLYYEALSQLVGPGRILVASAGNRGLNPDYMHKSLGVKRTGTFVTPSDDCVAFTVKASSDIIMASRFHRVSVDDFNRGTSHVSCDVLGVNIVVPVADVCAASDSLLSDTVVISGVEYIQTMQAYRSCYNSSDLMVDVVLSRSDGEWLWQSGCLTSFSVVGENSEAEVYRVHGGFGRNDEDITLNDAVATHGILSPGSAPSVICVGATAYRPVYTDVNGSVHTQHWGKSGERGSFSSVGPTFDGRSKPDVMAPGANVISAMSSYYMESNIASTLVKSHEYNGRTYGWAVNGGTSMSTPAVAGIIALWLQANPCLSPDDVLDIMRRTCKPCGDYGAATMNNCGYGAIDAYAGLLDVLNLTGIAGLSANLAKGAKVGVVSGNVVQIEFDAVLRHSLNVTIYDMSGRKLHTERLQPGNTLYNVSQSLSSGIYAVQVGDIGSSLVRLR